jgi:HTH-type transcriptional regulator/antitoxin HigA
MKPKIIRTEEAYEEALAFVESLMDAKPGSKQEEELELWALLIEQYEKERHPIADPDPIEAIRFRMEQLGLHRKDMERYMGQKSKVSEVLNRKRALSLPMIRSLHQHLGIPAAVLVREVALAKTGKPALVSRRSKASPPKSASPSTRQRKQSATAVA